MNAVSDNSKKVRPFAEQDAAVRRIFPPTQTKFLVHIQVSIAGVNHDSDNIQINQLLAATLIGRP